MRMPSEEEPSLERDDGQEQMVVSVVGGRVRIHSLKQALLAPEPEARQVFAGSPAEVAVFFRDIQTSVGVGRDACPARLDPARTLPTA